MREDRNFGKRGETNYGIDLEDEHLKGTLQLVEDVQKQERNGKPKDLDIEKKEFSITP